MALHRPRPSPSEWLRGGAYLFGSAGLHLIAWWSTLAAPLSTEPTRAVAGADAPAATPPPAVRTPPPPERLSILAATAAWFEADREPQLTEPPPPAPPPPAPSASVTTPAIQPGNSAVGGGSAGRAKRPRRPGGTFQSVPLKEKRGVELTVPKGDHWCIEVRGEFIAGRGHSPLTAAGSTRQRLGGHAKWSTLICQGKKCEAYAGPTPVKSGAVRVRVNDNRFEDNEGDLRARYVACPR